MASVNKYEGVCETLEIPRGDGTETLCLEWNKIENLIVYDEYGRRIRVGDIYKNQKTIFILVRVSVLVIKYRKSSNRSPRRLLVHTSWTPGFYSRPGVYLF